MNKKLKTGLSEKEEIEIFQSYLRIKTVNSFQIYPQKKKIINSFFFFLNFTKLFLNIQMKTN